MTEHVPVLVVAVTIGFLAGVTDRLVRATLGASTLPIWILAGMIVVVLGHRNEELPDVAMES